MDLSRLSVTVAGSGIGGSAIALFIARAGAQVTLLEKVPDLRAAGAGIALAENGLAVMNALGLGERIEEVAVDVGPARVVDASGRTLLDPREPRPRIVMLRRSSLQNVLLRAMEAEPAIDRRFGAEVIATRATGEVHYRAEQRECRHTADLIIGADGVHSRVRASGAFGAVISRPGITYLRGLVPCDVAQNEEAWTSAGLFGSFPVDGGTYFYASAGSPACREAVRERNLTALKTEWMAAYPAAEAVLAPLEKWDDLLLNAVTRVDCTAWHDGSLVLLGDAAHAMAPNLGQGGNSALVDAAILTDCLIRAETLEDALSRYTARRLPAVRKVADLSARLGTLAEWTNPVARLFRDRILMPVADALQRPEAFATLLQEDPALLSRRPMADIPLSVGAGAITA